MADDRQLVTVYGNPPTKLSDGMNMPARANGYGEQIAYQTGKGAYAYADEGSYFISRNPTIGTGIAGIAAADGAEGLENLFYLYNGSGTKRIYLDYLRLVVTAAGASGTTTQFVSVLDTAARYTSGGTALTIKPVNLGASNTTSVASGYFGALVTTAGGANSVTVGGGTLRTVVKVIGDVYTFDFGGRAYTAPGLATAGTAQLSMVVPHAPVVICPGGSFTLEIFAASQAVTGASFEFEAAWWEK